MKKITREHVTEESECFCEVHPNEKVESGVYALRVGKKLPPTPERRYSDYEPTKTLKLYLCSDCMDEVFEYLEGKYGVKPQKVSSYMNI